MHPAFTRTDHRPWPLPPGRWTWRQSWCDLLFAHWPVSPSSVRHLVPSELEIDEFDGATWVGLVPFQMEGVTLRPFPAIPFFSAFPELNLRLYVKHEGRSGVWFLSLDASRLVAVLAARRFFHLPYHHASMAVGRRAEGVEYSSVRLSDPSIRFQSAYAPMGEVSEARAGTLDHFLTERYCLFALNREQRIERTDIHHRPWPLQKAEVRISENSMGTPHGLRLEGPPAVVHFARRLDVVVWSPEAF